MEISDILEILKKQRNEDETKWLETRKAILEYYKSTLSLDAKDSIYEEENRLAKDVFKYVDNQRKE